MRRLLQIVLALAFGIAILEIFILLNLAKMNVFNGGGLLGLAAGSGALYYYLFERKKK